MGFTYFNNQTPTHTAGKAAGTKYFTISQQIFFLKATSREAELVNVPIDKAAGTELTGSIRPRTGISINPAPPPQITLIENAKKLTKNTITNVLIIVFYYIL